MAGRFEHVKGLFKGITWMQVGAGALAAATSLFLSSSIGIAGSIIGAAVGSVVTTLSSAVYKGFFTASDKAIKKRIGIEGEDDSDGGPPLGAHAAHASPSEESNGQAVDTTVPSYPTEAFTAAVRGTDAVAGNEKALARNAAPTDEGHVRPRAEAVETQDEQAGESPYGSVALPASPSSSPLQENDVSPYAQALAAERACDPYAVTAETVPSPACFPDEVARVKALAARRKARRRERLVAVGSLATGLVAVALCAAVILGATDGSGIGHRPGAPMDQNAVTTSEAPFGSEAAGTDNATDETAQGPSDPQAAAPGGDAPNDPSTSDATGAASATGTGAEGADGAPDTSGETEGTTEPSKPGEVEESGDGSADAPETGGSTDGADEGGDDGQSSTGTEAGEPAEAPTPAADDGTSGTEGAA